MNWLLYVSITAGTVVIAGFPLLQLRQRWIPDTFRPVVWICIPFVIVMGQYLAWTLALNA